MCKESTGETNIGAESFQKMHNPQKTHSYTENLRTNTGDGGSNGDTRELLHDADKLRLC